MLFSSEFLSLNFSNNFIYSNFDTLNGSEGWKTLDLALVQRVLDFAFLQINVLATENIKLRINRLVTRLTIDIDEMLS